MIGLSLYLICIGAALIALAFALSPFRGVYPDELPKLSDTELWLDDFRGWCVTVCFLAGGGLFFLGVPMLAVALFV